jgi:hypothetical protein
MDLGADGVTTFALVTFPMLRPSSPAVRCSDQAGSSSIDTAASMARSGPGSAVRIG